MADTGVTYFKARWKDSAAFYENVYIFQLLDCSFLPTVAISSNFDAVP